VDAVTKLSALWVRCLYVFKTILPITLSADYSYKHIRLVMGLAINRGAVLCRSDNDIR
jgi:hypothetical protein